MLRRAVVPRCLPTVGVRVAPPEAPLADGASPHCLLVVWAFGVEMAKRQHFDIQSTRGYHAVRFAWNASIRHIEEAARQAAHDENTTYRLVESSSEKDSSGNHVRGKRVWESTNGKSITFTCQKRE